MDDKIAELTRKLYEEGVEKGEARAQEIIAEAEQRAARIVADAESRANVFFEQAEHQATELKRNVDSEIRLSLTQAMSAFKQQILNSVIARAIDDAVTGSLSDPANITEFIKLIAQGWPKAAGQTPDLICLLPEATRTDLDQALQKAVSSVLTSGIDIEFSKTLKAGFRIGPRGGAFAVSFTDESFREFFKHYARPKARSYLFGE